MDKEVDDSGVKEHFDVIGIPSAPGDTIELDSIHFLFLRSFKTASYRNPYVQASLTGLTTFLSVGMFGVLNGLGGAGQVVATVADDANIVLYSVFAGFALFAGPLVTYFGPKLSLSIGGVCYCLYGAAFWCYNNTKNHGFVFFGGAMCGFGAALLWSSASVVMLGYATEGQKGKFIAIQFGMLYFGQVLGGVIPLGLNINNHNSGSVSNGTYAALTILMALSGLSGACILNPQGMVRTDGTRVESSKADIRKEIKLAWALLRKDPYICLFFPFSFGALYYNGYQTSDYEVYFFNVRTRTLNSVLFGASQMIATILFGTFLDVKNLKRKTRAYLGWLVLFVAVTAIGICGLFANMPAKRGKSYDKPLDMSGGARSRMYVALEFFFGFQDGMDNMYAFWLIGSLYNNPREVAALTGYFKVFSAIGAAVSFGQDYNLISYQAMYVSYWGVILGGVALLFPMIYFRVHNTEAKGDVLMEGVQGDVQVSQSEMSRR